MITYLLELLKRYYELNKKKTYLLLYPLAEINFRSCQALVAQAYNPSFSGGREKEDHSSKPAQGK
jgi:hypothetical protein